jgi:hypothetical protein
MISALPNDQIAFLGIGAQLACAIGVWFAGGWQRLLAYLFFVPLFWLVPFVLASGHLLVALDGVVVLPVVFLAFVCVRSAQATPTGPASDGGTREP